MNEVPTRNEILSATSERGLMAYLIEVFEERSLLSGTNFLETVAELIESGERTLFSERDWKFLNGMEGNPAFFRGVSMFCELIPLLDVGHRDMMQLVATLVHLGGEDLAASQPNAAFRDWCAVNPARVSTLLDDARTGNALANDYLCFVLEAGTNSLDALEFLNENSNPKAQIGAAIALGRMTLDAESATTAVHMLSEASIKSEDIHIRNYALLSIYAILGRHAELPHTNARRALDRALGDTSAETIHALSDLIWRHGKGLSEEEVG